MSKPIQEYWPDYYRDIKDFYELAATEDAELLLARAAITRLHDDQYVLTSGIEAIKRRELMLGIQADPSTETLEFRRRRIINRYSTKPPFTIRYLQQQLDRLVGAGRAIAEVDVQNFVLTIKTALEDASSFREILHTVQTVKPVNLVYEQTTDVFDVIEFREHMTSTALTRMARLSTTWVLGVAPFSQAGEEVVIL